MVSKFFSGCYVVARETQLLKFTRQPVLSRTHFQKFSRHPLPSRTKSLRYPWYSAGPISSLNIFALYFERIFSRLIPEIIKIQVLHPNECIAQPQGLINYYLSNETLLEGLHILKIFEVLWARESEVFYLVRSKNKIPPVCTFSAPKC